MKKKEKEVKKARPSIKDCNFQIELLANEVNWAFRKIKELEERIEELEKAKILYKPAKKAWWRFW